MAKSIEKFVMNWVQIKLGINHIFLALISAEYAMERVEKRSTDMINITVGLMRLRHTKGE